jgi:hypothetical protein
MTRCSCLVFSSLIVGAAILAVSGTSYADEGGTSHSPITTPSGKSSDFDKKAPTGRVDPHSGTVIPDSPPSQSQSHPEQPSGIGEKGSGQTQTTMERSGGPQPSASESMSKAAKEHGEGKTERAAKDLKSQKPSNR